MLACSSCGQQNPDGARYCNACAAALGGEALTRREERKVVTVLFADLVGFTSRAERLDPEDVRAVLSPYYARLRSELERFGGTVEKFIGDAVMAVFGAPVAHEDDPERAVRAALAIRNWLAEEREDLQVRIAVDTGDALVSLGARPSEGEGMVAGDVVNTAARLQAAAPVNGILVGQHTFRATGHVIDYREAKPIVAKGKSEPIEVWEAVQARARVGVDVPPTRAPLIGRERELTVLTGALDRARQERSPQLVTLVGVPGIGKSRLVYELFEVVEAESELVSWRQGRSLPYGEGVTYWALAELTKAEAGILETDAADQVQEKLRHAIGSLLDDGSEGRWVETHLRALVGLGEQSELGGDRRAESFSAWRRFFEALAERRPLVLVFEDLHWADENLLDFVDYLVEWASGVPLLVVCTARPELLERRPLWSGGKTNALTLSLSPLSDNETARLISELVGRHVLAAETQEALLEKAAGNPLYAEQFVRMLVERGEGDLPLPETVQGVIAARLDTLATEDKVLLQDAAVLGKVFWAGALAAIGDGEHVRVEAERLHVLERKEFLQRERRSSVAGESEYVFRHMHVRDVAYGQIPRAARAEKHRRAAEWIAALGRPEDHAEMIAHHYLAALQLARASGQEIAGIEEAARLALREAGDRVFALNAFGSATRFYGSALELWPREDPERPYVSFRYGEALRIAEVGGEEALVEARDGLLAAGDKEAAAEAEILLADLAWRHAQPERRSDHLARAFALVRDAKPSRAKAHVLTMLSRFRMLEDEPEEAIRLGRAALEIAEELGLEELRANALNTIGTARANLGDLGGLTDLERSIAIALAVNSAESLRGYNNLATVLEQLGDIAKANELLFESLRIAERFGNPPIARSMRMGLPEFLYWAGEWNQALRLADELIAEVEAGARHFREGEPRRVRGRVRVARGDDSGALEDTLESVQLARAAKDSQTLTKALASYGVVLLEADRGDDAANTIDELMSMSASRLRFGSEWADAALVFSALGRSRELLAALAGVPATRWTEAAKLYAGGEFEAAADLYAKMGMLSQEAQTRLRAAKEFAAEGKRGEADAQLQRALRFYRSVGATRYIREGEALLAASA